MNMARAYIIEECYQACYFGLQLSAWLLITYPPNSYAFAFSVMPPAACFAVWCLRLGYVRDTPLRKSILNCLVSVPILMALLLDPIKAMLLIKDLSNTHMDNPVIIISLMVSPIFTLMTMVIELSYVYNCAKN